MKDDEVTLKISETSEETQQQMRMIVPKLLKMALKRLGGKLDANAKELDSLDSYTLVVGLNPTTRKIRAEVKRGIKKAPLQ